VLAIIGRPPRRRAENRLDIAKHRNGQIATKAYSPDSREMPGLVKRFCQQIIVSGRFDSVIFCRAPRFQIIRQAAAWSDDK